MKRILLIGTLFPFVTLSTSVLAHAPDTYGFGSRSTAMGGAVTADVQDFSANYYNPAGLIVGSNLSLTLGYMYANNQLRTNGLDNNVDSVHGLVGGIVAPGNLFGIPFAFGISTYLPDDGLSRIKALRQDTPRWELYDDRLSILSLSTNIAFRPFSFLELGGGISFLAATRGRFGIRGTANATSPYESKLEHEVDADLTAIRYPQFGLRLHDDAWGALGITYRGQVYLPLSLDADLKGVVNFAGLEVPLEYRLQSRTSDAFIPQQVAIGFSFQKIENLHINADVTWVNWAAYKSPTAQTSAHLDIQVPIDVQLDLPEDPKPTVVIPPEFENRFVPRIGVEYLLSVYAAPHKKGDDRPMRIRVPLRGGYFFEKSPIPEQAGETNYIDADRHTFSFGTGVTLESLGKVLEGSIALDLHAQFSILPERVTQKTSSSDFIGDYKADGSMNNFGATITTNF